VVLDRLAPAERVAFVLHDVFGLAFAEIGPALSRSPETTKKLASRARQKVRVPASAERTPTRVHPERDSRAP
jgi:DNA-directed RNA polymerase specialized sigma24 family protein